MDTHMCAGGSVKTNRFFKNPLHCWRGFFFSITILIATCFAVSAAFAQVPEDNNSACLDTIDNDLDSLVDCADPDCRTLTTVCDDCSITECNDDGLSVGDACTSGITGSGITGGGPGVCYAGASKTSGLCAGDCVCLGSEERGSSGAADCVSDGDLCTTDAGNTGVCVGCDFGCECLATFPTDIASPDCPCFSAEDVALRISQGFTYTCVPESAEVQCAPAMPLWAFDPSEIPNPSVDGVIECFVEDPNYEALFMLDLVRNACVSEIEDNGPFVGFVSGMTEDQEDDCEQILTTCIEDTDGDLVADCLDNCVLLENPRQDDTDGDGVGDKCDPDTINPQWELVTRADTSEFFLANSPLYESRIGFDSGFEVNFAPGPGFFGPTMEPSDFASFLVITPMALDLGTTSLVKTAVVGTPAVQSTWQSVVEESAFEPAGGPPSPTRLHYSSAADGVGLSVEVEDMSLITGGGDVDFTFELDITGISGATLDFSATDGNGKGKITVLDGSATPVIRISALTCSTFGKATAIVDDCPTLDQIESPADPVVVDGNLSDFDFFGLTRIIEELDTGGFTSTACGPTETVGINHRDGVTSSTIKLRQELHSNQADNELGSWSASSTTPGIFTFTGTCDASFVAKNSGISSRMALGFGVASLTDSTIPTGSTLTGKHGVSFSEEFMASWNNVTINMDNTGPARFDGASTTDYSLFPNEGKTCEFNDCAQVHTALGFAGADVTLTGDAEVNFIDGGGGVGMGPGNRVASADPCLTSDPDLCIGTDFVRRGRLTFDNLTVNGGMGGLGCSESDCTGNEFTAELGNDPNATDLNILRARLGLGMAADKGPRIGWNVVTNEFVANVPIDTSLCSVGDGSCTPTALSDPGTTGIGKLVVNQVHLTAQSDLLLPTGTGFACGIREGRCDLGGLELSGTTCSDVSNFPKSTISGFETGIAVGGGANVDSDGVPLRHDNPSKVPTFVACLKNIDVLDSEIGASIGANIDATLDRVVLDGCQYNCLTFGQASANIATPATTSTAGSPCPSNDTIHCNTRSSIYAAPNTQLGEEDHRAATAAGVTAPTIVRIKSTDIACNCTGSGADRVCTNSSGQEPVLPGFDSLGPDLEISCDPGGPNPDLTFLGTPACGLKLGIGLAIGGDFTLYPELLDVSIEDSTLCLSSPPLFVDNLDTGANTAIPFVTVPGSCLLQSDQNCMTTGAAVSFATGSNEANDFNTALLAVVADTPPASGSDSSGDGVPDSDACPDDPDKTDPGVCGCGVPETCPPVGDPKDCAAIVDSMEWINNGAEIASLQQCKELERFDSQNKDNQSACEAKCNALLAISSETTISGREPLVVYCDAVLTRITAGEICTAL